jgi:hypothetical protein
MEMRTVVSVATLLLVNLGPAVCAARARKLLTHVPQGATAAAVLDLDALPLMRGWLDRDPEMKKELGSHLRRSLGVDLTGVRAVVGFATRLEPEFSGAVLLRLEKAGRLKGKAIGRFQGVELVRLGRGPMVAASVKSGLAAKGLVCVPLTRRSSPQARRCGPIAWYDAIGCCSWQAAASVAVFHCFVGSGCLRI